MPLAEAGFNKLVTVVNTSGMMLDTISVAEGTKTIGGREYTLTLNGDSLGISIGGVTDTTPPERMIEHPNTVVHLVFRPLSR